MIAKKLEKAKITFFSIHSCGYYAGGVGKSKIAFGDLDGILSQLAAWTRHKTLLQTQTFQTSADSEFLPVFLFDICKCQDAWLITLWNQTPSNENAVASVMANGSVGSATVHMNKIAPGSIPGFATYFWLLPSKGVFANVRFQHAVSGHAPMRAYIRGFMERSADHVVYAPDQATAALDAPDVVIEGYRANPLSPVRTDVHPRFSTSVFTKVGECEMLIKNAPSVTKIRHRTTLQLQVADDLEFWQKMWRRIKGSARPTQADAIQVEYDIKTSVTETDVRAIITQWNQGHDLPSWDDYGFQLKGDASTHWLSKTYARDEFELNVARKNEEIVEANSLLEELQACSGKILKLLD